MRIAIDYRPCLRPGSRRRGIGRFTDRLACQLRREDATNEYFLYTSQRQVPTGAAGFQIRSLPELRRPSRLNWLLDRPLLPRCLRRDRIDLFHATDQLSIPRLRGCRVWAYVHDLIPFIFWDRIRPGLPADFAWALQASLGRAARSDRIVTVSECSKGDIRERLGLPDEQVIVVYQDCAPEFRPRDPWRSRSLLEERFRLFGPYLLYVGGSDFRKNLPFLIRAFSRIRHQGYAGKLVLVGETFQWDLPETRELWSQARRCDLEDRIVCPGYVEDDDLSRFYTACDAFVFPSLYEGFGIPLLEAMRCGAPVLTSRAAAMREVAAEAALYFDPTQEESLVSAFCELREDEGLREGLREAGFRRARRFSWKNSARRLVELQEEVA